VGVQVKLWDPLRTRAYLSTSQVVFTKRRYKCIYLYLYMLYNDGNTSLNGQFPWYNLQVTSNCNRLLFGTVTCNSNKLHLKSNLPNTGYSLFYTPVIGCQIILHFVAAADDGSAGGCDNLNGTILRVWNTKTVMVWRSSNALIKEVAL